MAHSWLLAAVLGATLVATPAGAGPVSCRFVTDPAHDATMYTGASDDRIDLLSGDLAFDAYGISGLFRVADIDAEAVSPAFEGVNYELWFAVNGKRFRLIAGHDGPVWTNQLLVLERAVSSPLGGEVTWWRYVGPARSAVDLVRNEVRVTVTSLVMAKEVLIRPGQAIQQVEFVNFSGPAVASPSGEAGGEDLMMVGWDNAPTTKHFRYGTPTCARHVT